jgi:competence protein ComEA
MGRLVALLVALAFALSAGTTTAWAQPPKDPPKPQPKAPAAIDINSASADDLKALKGIGEADAKKIVENRPYKTKEELVQKKVLSKATYDKIKNQIVAK